MSVVAVVAAQQVLALHLALQTRDVSVAEVLAQFLHLLQFQKVNAQHLYGLDHLQCSIVFLLVTCSSFVLGSFFVLFFFVILYDLT